MKKELSVEELVALASKEITVAKLSYIEEFILEYNIQVNTEEHTEGQLIYWAYRKWCEKKDYSLCTRQIFFREFRKRFRRIYKPRRVVYNVTPAPFLVSKEEWWEMRRHFNEERKKNKKATKRSQEPQS